jgi:hypothetical protein
MSAPRCVVCAQPGQYNSVARGKFRNKETNEVTRTRPLKNPGWAHSDGARRDHSFTPESGHTPEADTARQTAERDQATSHVKGTLSKQFDYTDVADKVNGAFDAP